VHSSGPAPDDQQSADVALMAAGAFIEFWRTIHARSRYTRCMLLIVQRS
jgi:hypothetical protein